MFTTIFFCCGCTHEYVTDEQSIENEKINSKSIENVNNISPSERRAQEILANPKPNTKYSIYQKSARTNIDPIPKEIEEELIVQGEEMFSFVQSYDLESLFYYSPTIEEMEEYYKILDFESLSSEKTIYNKHYQKDGLAFGDNLEYDQFLLKRVQTAGSLIPIRSQSLTFEKVRIDEASVEVNKVYIKQSPLNDDFYDIHVRFKKVDDEEYYEIVNEACWLTDRTCISTKSWKFLGKYNIHTNKYHNSELHLKDVDADEANITSPLFKRKPKDKLYF